MKTLHNGISTKGKASSFYNIFFLGFILTIFPCLNNSESLETDSSRKQSQKIEAYITKSSRIQGLRVLGSSLSCSAFTGITHNGIDNTDLSLTLRDAACSLVDALPSNFRNEFIVFDYGAYMLTPFMSGDEGFEVAFQGMINEVENTYNASFYLLIGNQIDPRDLSNRFKIALKLPRTGEFFQLNDFLENSIQEMVWQAVEEKYLENLSILNVPSAEEAGINRLRGIIELILDGEFNGGLTEEFLLLNGFEIFEGLPTQIKGDGTPSLTGDVKDYAGVSAYINNQWLPMKDELVYALNQDTRFSKKFYITDNDNYGIGSSNEFEQVGNLFKADTQKYVGWMHILSDSNVSTQNKVYVKTKSNFTEQEAEQLIIGDIQEYLNRHRNTKPFNKLPCPCGEISLNCLASEWTVQNNLLPCIIEHNNFKWLWSYPPNEFIAGVVLGVLGGAIDIINIFRVENYTNDLTLNVLTLIGPQNFFATVVIKTVKNWYTNDYWDFGGALAERTTSYFDFVKSAKEAFTLLFSDINVLKNIITGIKETIIQWWGDVTRLDRYSGYTIGVAIFDIVMPLLTGGASAATKLAKDAGEGIIGLLKSVKTGNVRGWLGDRFNKAGKTKTTKCGILYRGCFVAGTPVLAGSILGGITSVPIEQIQLTQPVLAHTGVNARFDLLASTTSYISPKSNDPYTSDQQKERDGFEMNETDWYEVEFRPLQGTSYCKLALHKDWMTRQGMHNEGSLHYLSMPEQGIEGPSIISAIRQITPQKIPADDNPDDDYEFRPVTGIFVHESEDVLMLKFENGESLGVTENHPIYSTSYRGWQLAGELEQGEQVLTFKGNATVASLDRLEGRHRVYNLEVKDLHNFLVGGYGVVVHNNCAKIIADLLGIDLNNLVEARRHNNTTYKRLFMKQGGEIDHEEAEFLDEIGEILNENLVLPPKKNNPGFDAFYRNSGKTVETKILISETIIGQQKGIIEHSRTAYDQIKNANMVKTDVRIKAGKLTMSEAQAAWSGATSAGIYNKPYDEVVDKIIVHCKDGIITLKQ